MLKVAALMLTMVAAVLAGCTVSHYTVPMEDPRAVTLAAFAPRGDGVADDADALQAAINKVQETTRKGIVFIPEGRYRLGKTVYVWNGIRLVGWGKTRPVFVLGENTPGFQTGEGKYMVHFVSDRPRAGEEMRDANPGTFYSGMTNIDMEIENGNAAAICVKFHAAQHCFISHVDFRIGNGKAGIQNIGNEMEDVRFFGGDFGITTTKPSPSWPFLLIDSAFEGQRKAAIDTEEGGMTLVRDSFRNVPTVINVHENRAEELWMKDCRMEDITGPAMIISDEYNARCMINLETVVCRRVPVLAAFRTSGKQIPGPGAIYEVAKFSHGLQIADMGATPEIKTICEATVLGAMPEPVKSDIPALPPRETWVNLGELGAKGDGVTDDTAVLKEAIAKHRAIYLPTGRYRVTDTIVLQPDTVLIGLSPFATQILLTDTTPGFSGEGPPKAMLEAPKGGTNIVTGIGLDAGINQRAVAAKWMAGKDSLMNDVRFLGGHGTYTADGNGLQIYNNNRTADFDTKRRWDSQYWSLWITDGGGGTFKDIWTPVTFAQAGVYISDTSTEGRIYAMSIEHHVRNEVKMRNVSNWRVYDMQTEAERGESTWCQPLEMDNCRNITFANLYLYRVSIPYAYPQAVKLRNCQDITFHNVHVYSPGKTTFDNTVFDVVSGAEVRSREISTLTVSGAAPQARPAHESPVFETAKVEKVRGGFENIDCATADAAGNIYFIDPRVQRIYRWTPETHDLATICDVPIQPSTIALDQAGNVLVFARKAVEGWDFPAPATPGKPAAANPPFGGGRRRGPQFPLVYALRPGDKDDAPTLLKPVTEPMPTGSVAIHPLTRWRDAHDFLTVTTEVAKAHCVAPDGKTMIPLTEDLGRAFAIGVALPGRPFYVADEFGQKVVSFTVNPDGSLGKPKQLAEEGEAGVAVDAQGNVYVAAGMIFVYNPAGKLLDTLNVPERPTSLAFGGKDGRTLFITARNSLYAVRTRFKGQ